MAEPRTTREALIAEMLGELDTLIARVERLPGSIAEAETRLTLTAHILEDAGDKYRLAITAFTEEAKLTLTEYLKHKASQAMTLSIDEHRAALQHAVSAALRSETVQEAIRSSGRNKTAAVRQTVLDTARLIEHGVTAVLASVLTIAVLLLLVDLR